MGVFDLTQNIKVVTGSIHSFKKKKPCKVSYQMTFYIKIFPRKADVFSVIQS